MRKWLFAFKKKIIRVEEWFLYRVFKKKICYLTIDDGPSANTPKFLEILKIHKVKATFFVCANAYSSYLNDILANGHALALHSATHDYAMIYATQDAFFQDLHQIEELIFRVTQKAPPTVLRFPGGSSNLVHRNYCPDLMRVLIKEAQRQGYCYIDWDIEGDRENGWSREQTLNHVLPQIDRISKLQNRYHSCVLIHDIPTRPGTVEALPELIEYLKQQGYVFRTVSPFTTHYHHKLPD